MALEMAKAHATEVGVMRVALHDADKTIFPNIALMKLSAWHKAHGDIVDWFSPLLDYDFVYSSKVFSWTPEDTYLPKSAKKGGTGYANQNDELDPEIEHIMPDYGIYPHFQASLGFTTRGCIRSCPWCIVPKKEGALRPHADIEEFLRPDCRDIVLMDNNILAHEHGIKQLEKSIAMGLRVDCNQGLDSRLVADNAELAKMLAKVHWKVIRFACDKKSQMESVEKSVLAIRKYSGKKCNFSCYVLVQDIDDALERVAFLRGLGVDPFAQPYREPGSKKEPAKILKRFARWVNHKAIFKTVSWKEYQAGRYESANANGLFACW